MKDGLHTGANSLVVTIEWRGILCATGGSQILRGGQQRLDRFVSENHQRDDCLESAGGRLISALLTDSLHDVLVSEFLEVVGGAADAIVRFGLVAEQLDLTGQLRSAKSLG